MNCLPVWKLTDGNQFINRYIMSSDAAFFGDGSQVIQTTVTSDANLSRHCGLSDYYELPRCSEWLQSHPDIKKVSFRLRLLVVSQIYWSFNWHQIFISH